MQNRSSLWKELAASGSARLETSVMIDMRLYTPRGAVTVDRAAGQSALSCGNCISATTRFSLTPLENVEIPRTSAAVVQCRFTDGVARFSEWITVGTFYVTRRQNRPVNDVLDFEGYDAMQKANTPYPNLSGFPKAMNSAISEIAHNMGVEVDSRTWDSIPTGGDYYVPLPADGEKMIKILGYIGGVCGGNWIITPRGKLRLIPFVSASGAAEASDKVNVVGIMSSIATGDVLTVTGVEATTGTKRIFAGSDAGGIVSISSNPYATQAAVDALLTRYAGTVYTPYEIKGAIYDPAMEIGDYLISRSDVESVVYQESARYAPAFRGDLSAPFAPETSETERSLTDSISDSSAVADDLSVRIYHFVSQSAVTVGDGQSAEIINFDFAAGAEQDVVFHAEIKHTTETTETGNASTGWTCTDAVLTVTYYINGAEVAAYHPTKSEMDGANLLHLTYHFTNGQYNAGNFRVTLSLSGGSVAITAGDARAYIIGQGYSGGDTNWVTEDGLVFIGVESYPDKMNYTTGETLDLTGLVVKAYYADGTEADITADCAVTPADGAELEPGENVVSVSYTADGAEFADSFSVYCEANNVLFIEVTTPPTTTEYFPGEALDLTGVAVTATCEDGTETDVTSECVFTPADGTTLTGDETITVNAAYTENDETFTAYFDVNVKSVRIMSYPLKSDYFVGETLDYTGLEVVEALSDGTTRDVTSDCVLSPADGTTVSSAGDIMVDVRYNGKSLGTFWVAVASVAVTTPPDKVDYTQGDTLDLTGLVITEALPDGTTRDITPECTFTPPEGSTLDEPGAVTVTVEHDGVTVTTFDVEVAGEGVIVTVVGEITAGVVASGDWWTLYDNGLLDIYREGDIPDYSSYGQNVAPWSSYRRQITDIMIGDSVTRIGKLAFTNCSALTDVVIPGSVTSIGEYAFMSCSALTDVVIPGSVTIIDNDAFQRCYALENVTIQNGVSEIYANNFSYSKLSSIAIPSSVTYISTSVFDGCENLVSINVDVTNSSYMSIDGILFNYSQTTLVRVPIGKHISSYTIPASVTYIGDEAFRGCAELASINIHNSVTRIGWTAFQGCAGLKSINIPNSVIRIEGYAFSKCTGLTNITIPNGVSEIDYNTFDGCTSLTSVTIPDSVTSIDTSAFRNCTSLTSVTIPVSVRKVSDYAFYGCTALTDVYYSGTESQRAAMTIGTYNDPLLNATWHYNSTGPA